MIAEWEWMDLSPSDAYQFGLLPLAIWREAQNQSLDAMIGVGWAIRNRIAHPAWWGFDWPSVILHKDQFSSFDWDDPNDQKFPRGTEPSWQQALNAAVSVFTGSVPDPTGGATLYYSRDIAAPSWATDDKHTVDLGTFRFYRS